MNQITQHLAEMNPILRHIVENVKPKSDLKWGFSPNFINLYSGFTSVLQIFFEEEDRITVTIPSYRHGRAERTKKGKTYKILLADPELISKVREIIEEL